MSESVERNLSDPPRAGTGAHWWRGGRRAGVRLLLAALLLAVLAGCTLPAPPAGDETVGAPTIVIPAASATPAEPIASTTPADDPTAVIPAASATAAEPRATGTPAGGVTPTITPGGPIPVYGYRVLATYPHDPGAFTQGLVLLGAVLYEGTGGYGESDLRRVDLATGQVLQQRDLPAEQFGEGIAVVGERIYQVTWREQIGHVYDRSTFELLQSFSYEGEGWGLTYDGTRLIMSDGTANLRFLDPATLQETGRVEVRDENGPVTQLNELEYVGGAVYANIWFSDRIVRIDPAGGRVTASIDLTGIAGADRPAENQAVLNGIAYNHERQTFLVTGKLWPKLYEIVLQPASP